MIGKTLGHYEITGQLGKGGMGEAFQAKDQILGREVAIKKVKEQHSERIKLEARTVGRRPAVGNLIFEKGLYSASRLLFWRTVGVIRHKESVPCQK